MNRRQALLAVAAVAFVASAAPAAAQTADEIIEKYLAASGGRAAMAKLTSQVTSGTVAIATQMGNITGTVEITRKAPNKSRMRMVLDLSAMGAPDLVVDQRCDGTSGWIGNSMQGDMDATGSTLQSMLNNTFPDPLLDYKAAGGKVELAGQEAVGARKAWVLVHTPKTGLPTRHFIDTETFLTIKGVSTVEPPGMGAIEQATEVADYRAIDGIQVPFKITINSAMQTITITINSTQFNGTIDDAIFAKPVTK